MAEAKTKVNEVVEDEVVDVPVCETEETKNPWYKKIVSNKTFKLVAAGVVGCLVGKAYGTHKTKKLYENSSNTEIVIETDDSTEE